MLNNDYFYFFPPQLRSPTTLIVKFLKARQAAEHREPIAARVGSTAGVLSQPEHSEARQRTQVTQLREGRDRVLPQVELT